MTVRTEVSSPTILRGLRIHRRRLTAFLFGAITFAAVALCQVVNLDAQNDDPPLFDGRSLRGWTYVDGKAIDNGWEVVDGAIHLEPSKISAGSIVTDHEYGDFDLSFEWKISPGCNSGLKYRVRNYGDKTLGCEYQIIDEYKYRKIITPKSSIGSLYDLFEPNNSKRVHPLGEFNLARIVVHDNEIQHWLNGKLIVVATIGSEEWNRRIGDSKFSDVERFALNPRGKIMLTDHGGEVWFRNFRLRLPHQCSGRRPPRERSNGRTQLSQYFDFIGTHRTLSNDSLFCPEGTSILLYKGF